MKATFNSLKSQLTPTLPSFMAKRLLYALQFLSSSVADFFNKLLTIKFKRIRVIT
jgi:hypothetical protein